MSYTNEIKRLKKQEAEKTKQADTGLYEPNYEAEAPSTTNPANRQIIKLAIIFFPIAVLLGLIVDYVF